MKKTEFSALALVVTTALSACGGRRRLVAANRAANSPSHRLADRSGADRRGLHPVYPNHRALCGPGRGHARLQPAAIAGRPGDALHDRHVWNGQSPVPPVRLSALGGPLTVALAESLQVPVGRVTWIRLHFATGSYVSETNGGEHPLACPSCEPTDNNAGRGFKLNRTFEVESGGLALTVDIDLLKSLHEDSTGYVLRPTARIENTAELGTIAGRVDEGLPPSRGTMARCSKPAARYTSTRSRRCDRRLSSGLDVVSSARVRYSVSLGHYGYAAGALPGGTVAHPSLTRSRSLATRTIQMLTIVHNLPEVRFTLGQNATWSWARQRQ